MRTSIKTVRVAISSHSRGCRQQKKEHAARCEWAHVQVRMYGDGPEGPRSALSSCGAPPDSRLPIVPISMCVLFLFVFLALFLDSRFPFLDMRWRSREGRGASVTHQEDVFSGRGRGATFFSWVGMPIAFADAFCSASADIAESLEVAPDAVGTFVGAGCTLSAGKALRISGLALPTIPPTGSSSPPQAAAAPLRQCRCVSRF